MKAVPTNRQESHVLRSYGVMYFVNEAERSIEFYRKLLGREPSYRSDTWIEFDLGDENLCLHPTDAHVPMKTPTRIVLEVKDLDGLKNFLDQEQIKIVDAIQQVREGEGRFMNVQDPDGNIVGLYEAPSKH